MADFARVFVLSMFQLVMYTLWLILHVSWLALRMF